MTRKKDKKKVLEKPQKHHRNGEKNDVTIVN